MHGKYLIIENKNEEELLYNIVDFLWASGNEVIVQGNFHDEEYYGCFLDKNPWIIVVDENNALEAETLINMKQHKFKNMVIHFSATGVYTNAIPFPHRIFEFERLSTTELNRFFNWCTNLNLFSSKMS